MTLRWVPAHMPERAVREGRITRQDSLGNNMVDKLAGEASTDLWVPDEMCRGLKTIKTMVKEVYGAVAAMFTACTTHSKWPDVETVPWTRAEGAVAGRPRLPRRLPEEGGHDGRRRRLVAAAGASVVGGAQHRARLPPTAVLPTCSGPACSRPNLGDRACVWFFWLGFWSGAWVLIII